MLRQKINVEMLLLSNKIAFEQNKSDYICDIFTPTGVATYLKGKKQIEKMKRQYIIYRQQIPTT